VKLRSGPPDFPTTEHGGSVFYRAGPTRDRESPDPLAYYRRFGKPYQTVVKHAKYTARYVLRAHVILRVRTANSAVTNVGCLPRVIPWPAIERECSVYNSGVCGSVRLFAPVNGDDNEISRKTTIPEKEVL